MKRILSLLITISFSLFSQQIAFTALVDGSWQLYVTDKSGENTKQITQMKSDVRFPSWDKSHEQITFSTTAGTIYTYDMKTAQLIDTIASPTLFLWQGVKETDSTTLLIAGNPKEIDQTFITRYNVNQESFTTVLRLRTPVYHIDYLPQTKNVLFANTLCGTNCGRIIQEIWEIQEIPGKTVQLTRHNSMCRYPKWNSTGTGFLYDSETERGFSLFSFSETDNSPKELFFPGLTDCTKPDLSPNDKEILFISNFKLYICPVKKTKAYTQIYPFGKNKIQRIKDAAW